MSDIYLNTPKDFLSSVSDILIFSITAGFMFYIGFLPLI